MRPDIAGLPIETCLSEEEVRHLTNVAQKPSGVPTIPQPPLLAIVQVDHLRADQHGVGKAIATGEASSFAWTLHHHFDGDPIVPGVLLVDGLFQLAGIYAGQVGFRGKGRAVAIEGVRFRSGLSCTTGQLTYRIDVDRCIRRRQILSFSGTVVFEGSILVDASCLKLAIV